MFNDNLGYVTVCVLLILCILTAINKEKTYLFTYLLTISTSTGSGQNNTQLTGHRTTHNLQDTE